MAYDENTATRVRRFFAGRKGVVEKSMVGGGLSFMVSGNMCCGVSKSALMVRVGPEAYEQALTEPHTRPLAFAGRAPVGYVCIDPEGYASDAAFGTWIQRGIDFVSTLPKRVETKKSRRKATRK